MIIAKPRKLYRQFSYGIMVMGLLIFIVMAPRLVELASSHTGLVIFLSSIILLFFFGLPLGLLTTRKELELANNQITLRSNRRKNRTYNLETLTAWRVDLSYQEYHYPNGYLYLDLSPKNLVLAAYDYDKFDELVAYMRRHYASKEILTTKP